MACDEVGKTDQVQTTEPTNYGEEFGFYFTCSRENLEGMEQGSHWVLYRLLKDHSSCRMDNGHGGAGWNKETAERLGGECR